jgi:hypothetical protein
MSKRKIKIAIRHGWKGQGKERKRRSLNESHNKQIKEQNEKYNTFSNALENDFIKS